MRPGTCWFGGRRGGELVCPGWGEVGNWREYVKGWEGLKAHIGNSVSLWNIHVDPSQKPEKWGSDCHSARNKMEKIRVMFDFPLPFMILPMILYCFHYEDIKEKTSVCVCVCVCILMCQKQTLKPMCSSNPLPLLPGCPHFSAPLLSG